MYDCIVFGISGLGVWVLGLWVQNFKGSGVKSLGMPVPRPPSLPRPWGLIKKLTVPFGVNYTVNPKP